MPSKGSNEVRISGTELHDQHEKAQGRWNQLFVLLFKIGKVPGNMSKTLHSTTGSKLLDALCRPIPPGMTALDFNEDVVQCVQDSQLDLAGKFGQEILASIITHVAENEDFLPYELHNDHELSSLIGAERMRENIARSRQGTTKTLSLVAFSPESLGKSANTYPIDPSEASIAN